MQTDFRLEGYFISTYWTYELVWIWHVDMEGNVVNTDGTTQTTHFYSVTAIRLSKDAGEYATSAMIRSTQNTVADPLLVPNTTSQHIQ
jgi:hypothetical protein